MMKPGRTLQFIAFLLIYFIVPFCACLFTLLFANYTASAFLPDQFLALFEATQIKNDLTLAIFTWAPFPIITLILFFYSLPIAKFLFSTKGCNFISEERARHRIVHSPLTISILGFIGWELSNFLSVCRIDRLFPEAPHQSIVTV